MFGDEEEGPAVFRGRHTVLIRGIIAISLLPVAFILLEHPFRDFEMRLAVGTLNHLGMSTDVVRYIPSSKALIFHNGFGFLVDFTASCSALAPMLGLIVIASLIDRSAPRGRQLLATTAAVVAIFIGNQIRVDASMAAGVGFGQGTLVLFHDWAGSIFGFAYMTLGFILMLWLLLPREGRLEAAGLPLQPA